MIGGRPKTAPGPKSRSRAASKKDAVREAVAEPADDASGRALVDLLCADSSLTGAAVSRIRALADRSLTPADLAGMLAYRFEKLRAAATAEKSELTVEREITALDKLGVFATSIVQLQAAQTGSGGAQITVSWGGFQAPAPAAGRVPRARDGVVGDLVEAE